MGPSEAYISIEGKLIFQLASSSHCEQISQLLVEEFVAREPLSRALHLEAGQLRGPLGDLVEQSVNLGLCTIAYDMISGKVVAACVFQDYRFPFYSERSESAGALAPIVAMIQAAYEGHRPDPKTAIELHACAVSKTHASESLATRLVLYSRKPFAKRGYKRIFSVLTNPASQRAFTKFAAVVSRVACRDFIWNGDRIFANADVPDEIVLVSRTITDSVTLLASHPLIRANMGRWKSLRRACVELGLRP